MSITLDAGALIAAERGDRRLTAIIVRANLGRKRLALPVGALAQVWRDGRKQARLARLLKSGVVELVSLDPVTARKAGELCGRRGTDDVIDATVVICARSHGHAVVTSDPGDLHRLDPTLQLIVV